MRATLLSLLLISGTVVAASDGPIRLPPEVRSGKWRMLDKTPRARTVASWWTPLVTATEFRKMRLRYRPQDFDMWAKRLRQLRPGMTEKEVIQILQPRGVAPGFTAGGMVWNSMFLNDAYFADIYVEPHSKRMISATPPLAMTYEIKSGQKKHPKT